MVTGVKKVKAFLVSLAVLTASIAVPVNSIGFLNQDSISIAHADETITIDQLPSEYKSSMDWIWQNRILDEKSTDRLNLIYDQIIAGDGTLNYVVRWQSYQTLTYSQRQKMEDMISRQINAWTKWLVGFENWPYDEIDVNIVGWAVIDESVILDKHSDEVVYTTCTSDSLHNDNSAIPALLPYAPTENSRADHFADSNYKYPGTRFDMYLWGTTGFVGGAGGDWGQRISDTYILSVLDSEDAHIIEHEIGHGFGMTDFYEEYQCPEWPEGSSNIMVAGWANQVTDYDGWMLRYIWNKIKDENGRFNISENTVTTTQPTVTTTTSNTTMTTATNDVTNGVWSFDVSNSTSAKVTISGEPYSGVAGTYTCLDSNGNILSQDTWMMSNSLGSTGTDAFDIALPTNCVKLKLNVTYYAVWDSSIGDNKDLNFNDLNISTSLSGTTTTEPTVTTVPISTNEPITTTITSDASSTNSKYVDVSMNGNTVDLSAYVGKVSELKLTLSRASSGSGAVYLKKSNGDWIDQLDYSYNNTNTVTIDLSKYKDLGILDLYTWWNSANATITKVQALVTSSSDITSTSQAVTTTQTTTTSANTTTTTAPVITTTQSTTTTQETSSNDKFVPVTNYSGTIKVSDYTKKKVTGIKFDLTSTSTGSGAIQVKSASGDWLGSTDYEFNNSNTVTIDVSKYNNIELINIYMWWNNNNSSITNIQLIVE